MRRILLALVIGVGALAAALFVGSQVASHVRGQVVTAKVVVARQPIPAYAVISAEMVEEHELPREVTRAPIYLGVDEVVGKMARLDIPAGVPIYKVYAIPPSEVRFTEDGAAVILSVPIDTVRAVGGLVQAGHRVDIYRIAKARPQGDKLAPEDLLALHGAAVEMVSPDVRVLGVKATGATQVTNKVESNPALPGLAVPLVAGASGRQVVMPAIRGHREPDPRTGPFGGGGVDQYCDRRGVPAGGRGVAAAGRRAERSLRSMAHPVTDAARHGGTGRGRTYAHGSSRGSPGSTNARPDGCANRHRHPDRRANEHTSANAVTTPAPGVLVRPGSAQGLNVRSGPGLRYPVLTNVAAGTRLEPIGRNPNGDWLAVCCVAPDSNGAADKTRLGVRADGRSSARPTRAVYRSSRRPSAHA